MKPEMNRAPNVISDCYGNRWVLVWLLDHCHAGDCKKPRRPESLICEDCFFDGWTEVSSEFDE